MILPAANVLIQLLSVRAACMSRAVQAAAEEAAFAKALYSGSFGLHCFSAFFGTLARITQRDDNPRGYIPHRKC